MPVKTTIVHSPEHLWWVECPWCGESLSYIHSNWRYDYKDVETKGWHFCPYCGEGIRTPHTEEVFPPLEEAQ